MKQSITIDYWVFLLFKRLGQRHSVATLERWWPRILKAAEQRRSTAKGGAG